MAIIPSILNFSYKKGDSLPPNRKINYDPFVKHTTNGGYFNTEVDANWVDGFGFTDTSGTISLRTSINSLSAGSHSARLKLYYIEITGGNTLKPAEPSRDFREFENLNRVRDFEIDKGIGDIDDNKPTKKWKTLVGEILININITEPVILNATPEALTFTYELGSSVPSAKMIQITSENNWSVSENCNWLSLSKQTGSNNGSFSVSVTPAGLNMGTHTTDITVKDGVTTKVIPVKLIVSEPQTGGEYLYVTPQQLNFVRWFAKRIASCCK